MHAEAYAISPAAAAAIERARAQRAPRRRRRHDRRARPRRQRGATYGRIDAGRARDGDYSLRPASLSRRGRNDHQLSPAALDAPDARQRLRGTRSHPCAPTQTRSARIPVFLVRRRDVASAHPRCATCLRRPGGPEVLRVATSRRAAPGPGEVLIAVEAAGVSRADAMQRQGNYPPPPGASPILGLEVAGTDRCGRRGRDALDDSATRSAPCVNGGGYARVRRRARKGQVLAGSRRLEHGRGGDACRRMRSRCTTTCSCAAALQPARPCSCTAEPAASARPPSCLRRRSEPVRSPPRASTQKCAACIALRRDRRDQLSQRPTSSAEVSAHYRRARRGRRARHRRRRLRRPRSRRARARRAHRLHRDAARPNRRDRFRRALRTSAHRSWRSSLRPRSAQREGRHRRRAARERIWPLLPGTRRRSFRRSTRSIRSNAPPTHTPASSRARTSAKSSSP